jgi:hypothetical protein
MEAYKDKLKFWLLFMTSAVCTKTSLLPPFSNYSEVPIHQLFRRTY